MKKKIVVVGSMGMDLVVTSSRRPRAGETIIGDELHIIPGGKGANQAVAAARLGADVTMVGAVGTDQFGEMVLANFEKEGVSTDFIRSIPGTHTGTAHIIVAEGDNSIVVVPGANSLVDQAQVDQVKECIKEAAIVLLQLEIPLETVKYVVDFCYEHQVPVILNPAPAQSLPEEFIQKVTYLTPNEHEVCIIFGCDDVDAILQKYPNQLILTEGEKGVRFFDGKQMVQVPALSVEVVDTTGAGDTFNAGFAVALTQGFPLKEAVRFGCVAAGLSVTKLGAQGGMPTLNELKQHLGEIF
ncbi:ribokinase [Thermoflavimicrobium dichotomicum]|uniref:Ribokinase n=1 Tax=Thermoflavimicrobium dichotomicum TaxID=46223 RepID=A0A1I3V1F5_9BACL|nr:ribokinase [Thermoflavimicrobium dichotomicum]SFJ88763.1 ribokinase [Thermoflavimicrobium dichotomicum]